MVKNRDFDADIIIVGGGPAGLGLAAILGRHGIAATCIDREKPADTLSAAFDGRTTAISYGSRRVMQEAGAWDALAKDACAIDDIQILDSDSPVLLDFLIGDVEGEAFGWIVENRALRAELLRVLEESGHAKHIAPAAVTDFSRDDDGVNVHLADGRVLRSQLVIGADGRQSFTRDWMGINTRAWTYKQRAIVCTVTHENPHNHIAIEHFRPDGPFAVLPMADDENGLHRSSVVWTEHGNGKSALEYDETTFNAALNARFPDWYGAVALAGKRFSYPLGLVHAHDYVAPRMALVADAAHGIHPIAGQGLNLGLRDIALLAELLVEAKRAGADYGNAALLETYQSRRRFDNMAMAATTDALNRLFSNNITPIRLLRQIGLRAVQKTAPARRFFMKQAMGAAGSLPKIIRGEKI